MYDAVWRTQQQAEGCWLQGSGRKQAEEHQDGAMIAASVGKADDLDVSTTVTATATRRGFREAAVQWTAGYLCQCVGSTQTADEHRRCEVRRFAGLRSAGKGAGGERCPAIKTSLPPFSSPAFGSIALQTASLQYLGLPPCEAGFSPPCSTTWSASFSRFQSVVAFRPAVYCDSRQI